MQTIKLISLNCAQTAAQWLAAQSVKPKNVINGSLWDMANPGKGPIGTVFIDGKVVKDSGNGDGFGVNGVPRFGRAYGDIKWREFLSSYPTGLIVAGNACGLLTSNPVTTSVSTRSVVYMQDGLVRFSCFPAQTMAALQKKLLDMGVTEAVALDGGGSCFLYDNGVQTTYKSDRKLMNILVEYEATETIDGVPLKRKLCPTGLKNNPELGMTSKYITIHNTGNYAATATAKNHADYLYGGSGGSQISWHYTVDKDGIYQSFEDTRRCWHAGDGSGPGNASSIGIEICVHDKAGFTQACQNAAKLTSHLLKKHGLTVNNVVQHNKWSGKNCPAEIRTGNWGVTWTQFLQWVQDCFASVPSHGTNILYHVQVGAFGSKENAEHMVADLKKEGFADAFIVEKIK